MTIPSDFSLRLPLPAAAEPAQARRSRVEDEVVALFDELRDRLLRYLLYMGLTIHDGEEIVQESFVLLFQHLQNDKSRENLRGWLFAVSRNLALKFHRERASAGPMVPFDEELVGISGQGDGDPEQHASSRQRQKQLLAVVRALPEQDQVCLFLRAQGMRYREIGGMLGMSLGSVAASLARSLGKLQRADGGSI